MPLLLSACSPSSDDTVADDDDTSVECTQHTQCDGDEFCRANECETIFGRSFNIELVSAVADQFDGDGGG